MRRTSRARLEALIEEATVDAYGDEEQLVGLLTMIQDNLELPFETALLGVTVMVKKVDQDQGGGIVAICHRNGSRQAIPILGLPLPKPAPAGAEWIEALRLWAKHQ